MSKITTREQGFIEYLGRLVNNEDRGAIANLRRGLGKSPGTVPQMDRYVLKFLPEDTDAGQEEPYYLVASLFAFWHQGRDDVPTFDGNLGNSLRSLVETETRETGKPRDEIEKRHEKRLVAILNCHADDLPEHLRHIVGLLKAKDVPVNWWRLLRDIKGWNWESRSVQRDWARGFWAELRGTDKKETDMDTVAVSEAAEEE